MFSFLCFVVVCFLFFWAQFHRAAKHKNLLSMKCFPDKIKITSQTSIYHKVLVTGIQLLFAYPENHMEIWLENLFLSRKKFLAKRICVLSSFMQLGPAYRLQAIPCQALCPIFYKRKSC